MTTDTKQRLMMGLIALPIGILLGEFVSDHIYKWIYYGFLAVCLGFGLYFVFRIELIDHRLDQSKKQAERWKRRICSIADSTESPDADLTFDEFCEFEDDKVLDEVVRELERMPSGKRHLKKAYEIVTSKAGALTGSVPLTPSELSAFAGGFGATGNKRFLRKRVSPNR